MSLARTVARFFVGVPQVVKASAYTLTAADTSKHVRISTGGITVPSGVFAPGDALTIVNYSGSDQTITQGGGVTLRQAATANTGNRTLAGYGIATILCIATDEFLITGAGLS